MSDINTAQYSTIIDINILSAAEDYPEYPYNTIRSVWGTK